MTTEVDGGPGRIGVGELIAAGLARLRAGWPVVLMAAVGGVAARYAIDWALPTDTRPASLRLTPEYLLWSGLHATAGNVAAVAAIWGLLDARSRPAPLGRGTLECFGALCVFSAAHFLITAGGIALGTDRDILVARTIGSGVARAILEYLIVLSCLWPVSRLAGHGAMTPARSWRLMRGATLSYVVVMIVLIQPVFWAPGFIAVTSPPEAYPERNAIRAMLSFIWGEGMRMLGFAFAVTILERRASRPGSVGEVFD